MGSGKRPRPGTGVDRQAPGKATRPHDAVWYLDRELERMHPLPTHTSALPPILLVGRGRVGTALHRAGTDAGLTVTLAGRDDLASPPHPPEAALLCVPDGEIAAAAAATVSAHPDLAFIGHTSGASGLHALPGDAGSARFSLHPLQTVPEGTISLVGAPAAVAGSSEAALGLATGLAQALGMRPFEVPEESRAAYHAAASIASNFLIALEASATELLAAAGVEDGRELLAPLVLQTAANWSERGEEALTGPIARGDEATVDSHRAALRELAPHLEPLYEALAERTRAIARSERAQTAGRS